MLVWPAVSLLCILIFSIASLLQIKFPYYFCKSAWTFISILWLRTQESDVTVKYELHIDPKWTGFQHSLIGLRFVSLDNFNVIRTNLKKNIMKMNSWDSLPFLKMPLPPNMLFSVTEKLTCYPVLKCFSSSHWVPVQFCNP